MQKRICETIEQFDVITVFRHVRPDADALGSQWGLITYIQSKYPSKKVYALGKNDSSKGNLFPLMDVVSDEIVASSLAIILDTANSERVDDFRYTTARKSIRIDHHVKVDEFAEMEWIDEKAASTCEMIAKLLLKHNKDNLPLQVAEYLYRGILTDTLKFSTTNTSSNTLLIACELAKSNIDLPKINAELFMTSRKMFHFSNYVRAHAIFEDCGLCYVYISQAIIQEYAISTDEAKECVQELGNIEGVKIWLILTQGEDQEVLYGASIRSVKGVPINDIANLYNGGGHVNAVGIKGLSYENTENLLNDLRNRAEGIK